MVPPPSSPRCAGFSARKAPIEDGEGDEREQEEDARLERERRPEDVREAERGEPERVDVVRQRRPAAEEDDGQRGERYHATESPFGRRRPVDGRHIRIIGRG